MSTVIQMTFDHLDPTAPLGGSVECEPNDSQYSTVASKVTIRSRVKAGQLVSVALTKSQQNRIPLNREELALVESIEKTVSPYKLALARSQDILFGKPFEITLQKKDVFKVRSGPKSKKKRGKQSQKALRRKQFHIESDSSSSSSSSFSEDEVGGIVNKDNKKSSKKSKLNENIDLLTIDDQPETIMLPQIASQVQEEYWNGPCKTIMEKVLKTGICAIYLIPKEITVPTYYKSNDSPRSKESSISEDSDTKVREEDDTKGDHNHNHNYNETDDPEYNEKSSGHHDNHEFHPQFESSYYKNSQKSNKKNDRKNQDKLYDVYVDYKDQNRTDKLSGKLRDKNMVYGDNSVGGNNDFQDKGDLTTGTDSIGEFGRNSDVKDKAKKLSKLKKRKKKTISDSEMREILQADDKVGPANALEAFGIPYERDEKSKEAPLKVPMTGEVVKDGFGIMANSSVLLSELKNNPLSPHYSNIGPIGSSSIADEVSAPHTYTGNKPTEDFDEKSKTTSKSSNKRKRTVIGNEDEDVTSKRRKGKKKHKRNKKFNVPYIEQVDVTETHFVPIIPDDSLGEIEVYETVNDGPRFMWTWKNTGDEFEGKIEPYMMFIVKHSPTSKGHLTSALSTMIPEYKTCENGKRQQAEMIKAAKNPIYVISKPEPKLVTNINGGLTQENYVSMATGTSVGGNGGGTFAIDANTNTIYPASQRWLDPNHPQALTPSGYRSQEGPGSVSSWNTGSLMDKNSRDYLDTFNSVQTANVLNGMYGDPNYLARVTRERQANAAAYLNASNNTLHRLDPGSVLDENIAQAEAGVASARIGREVIRIPSGTIWELRPGETIAPLPRPETYSMESAVESSKERLEGQGAVWGGFSLASIYNPKGKKNSEGAFTSKVVSSSSNASNYGLGVSHMMQSPEKECERNFQNEFKNFFRLVLKKLFTISYSHVFRSKEEYWKKLLQNTFIANPSADVSRRHTEGGSSAGKNSLPSFQSFFEVTINFPFHDTMGLNVAMDLCKLGLYTPEDLIPFMAALDNGSVLPHNCIKIVQERKRSLRYKELKERVETQYEALKKFEIDKVKKPEATSKIGGSATGTKKKTNQNKGSK